MKSLIQSIRHGRLRVRALAAVVTLAVLYGLHRWVGEYVNFTSWFRLAAVLLVVLAVVCLLWQLEPALLISLGMALSVFSGNWQHLGLPAGLAPDRMLLLAGILVLLFRGPAMRNRPWIHGRGTHVALAAAAIYLIGSAMVAGTLFQSTGLYRILDRFSLVAFVIFVVAPIAFRTERQRQILLRTMVILGAYLGLTALFETIGLKALVWPRYILDPQVGLHYGRARGPFVEASTNAFGMFATGIAAAVAVTIWRNRLARIGAAGVVALCAAGELFALSRSAWIGSAAAVLITMVAFRELRRYLVPAAVTVLAIISLALAVIPGLSTEATTRKNDQLTELDRQTQYNAAIHMAEARPLFGFGWNRYADYSADYLKLNPTQPLWIPLQRPEQPDVHNVFLSNLAELGLVGTSLWILALIMAIGGAVVRRGPPELRPWRMALLAVTVQWTVLISFAPVPTVFPNYTVWLFAGVVTGPMGYSFARARLRRRLERPAPAGAVGTA